MGYANLAPTSDQDMRLTLRDDDRNRIARFAIPGDSAWDLINGGVFFDRPDEDQSDSSKFQVFDDSGGGIAIRIDNPDRTHFATVYLTYEQAGQLAFTARDVACAIFTA